MNLDIVASLEPRLYPAASVHQEKIEQYFGETLIREWTGAERQLLSGLDLYFVVFTNRSGSTYLTEIMHQMGAGVHPRAEYFNYDMVLPASRREGYETFCDYLLDAVEASHHNRKVGFKIAVQQLFWITRLGLFRPFKSVRLVESSRLDLLGQAVSHFKARVTGKWHSLIDGGRDVPVVYSREEILKSLLTISSNRGLLDYYCSIHGPRRLEVVYEALLENPAAEMRRVADFLDLNDFESARVDLDAIGIQQQRDAENEALKRTFAREFCMQPDDRAAQSGCPAPPA